MRVTVEKLPQSSVRLDIVADADEFNEAMERAFRRVSRQVRIPGFRPGRAPRAIIEQRLGREVIVDEAQRDIMDSLYRRALEQEDLVPVSDPTVDIYQQEPVGFRVEVEVYPEVSLGDYQSLRVEPREVNISDEDLDEALEDLRKAQAVWVEPSEARKPVDGDQVIVDLEVTRDGEQFQEPLEAGSFILGESSLFPQIEEAIKSLSPGEQAEFAITFDEDDEKANPEIRGATLQYKLTLKEVKERELPELDDELAKSVGEYETLDELKEALRADLLRGRAVAARSEVINEAVEALAGQASVEIPPAMVDRQIEEDIERLSNQLAQQGSTLDEYLRFEGKTLEEYKEAQREDAERRLRNSVVLEAFAKAEEIEVTDDDLLAEIERLAAPSENAEQMREIYSSPYFRGMLMDELSNRKMTDRLLEIVTDGQGPVTGEGAEALRQALAPAAAEDAEAEAETETEAEEAAEAEPVDAEAEEAAESVEAEAEADDAAAVEVEDAGAESATAADAEASVSEPSEKDG